MTDDSREFLSAIDHLKPDFRSLDLRIVALRWNDIWVNLSTRILLSTARTSRRGVGFNQSGIPELLAKRAFLPVGSLGRFLKVFESGVLELDGLQIQCNRITSSGAGNPYRPYFQPHSRESSRQTLGVDARTFNLSGGESMIEATLGVRGFQLLESKLAAFKKPYKDMGDFLRSTTGHRGFQGWHSPCFVEFIAPVNIRLEESCALQDSKLHIDAIMRKGHQWSDCAVGIIQQQADTTLRREQRRVELSRRGEQLKLTAEAPLLNRTEKVTILLSYRGDLVDSRELFRNRIDGQNPRLEVLKAIDPNLEWFERGLGGRIPRSGGGFEHAFTTLFSLLGFSCLHLPAGDQPDVLAWGANPGIVLVVECTTAEPDLRNKATKLAARTRHIQSVAKHSHVVAVLATTLPRSVINAADIERIRNDRIVLLDRVATEHLLELAKNAAGPAEGMSYLDDLAIQQRTAQVL